MCRRFWERLSSFGQYNFSSCYKKSVPLKQLDVINDLKEQENIFYITVKTFMSARQSSTKAVAKINKFHEKLELIPSVLKGNGLIYQFICLCYFTNT